MKVGIFLPNWIGDVVMATPTLRALRNHFGSDTKLVGIMRPYVREVLAGTPWLDDCLLYDPRSRDRALRGTAFLSRLRAAQLDTVVLLTNSLRTALWAWASGAKRRIGYARSGRGPLLTEKLRPQRIGRRFIPSPVLDYYLALAYKLGCPPESPRLDLATLSADELAADVAWRQLNLPAGEHVVTFNSGGAYGAAKLWPTDYFARLARRVATQHDVSVLVLCGPQERDIAREIVAGARHPRVVSLAELPKSLGLTKACVRRSRLLVTTDSGPRHFAAAFDTPVITLFGPTDIAWSENHFDKAVHLQLSLDCQPCQKRVCPLRHHRCMRELSISRVYEAVRRELETTHKEQAA